MKRALVTLSALPFLAACGGSSAPPEPPVAEPPPAAAPAPTPAPEAKAPEPTPEEKKKAEEQKQLKQDFAKLEAEHKAELERFTPELRAEAKALAEKSYPSGKAAIQAALSGKHRKPGHPERDKFRHPVETLEFLGFKPQMTVLEYSPGEGWYTELLAPALAKKGKLFVTTSDPEGPADQRSTLYGKRVKLLLEKSPELFGKVEPIKIDGKKPELGLEGKVDLAVVIRGLHGMQTNGTLGAWLSEFHQALKPKGVLGIVQHRAKEGADVASSAKKGYLPQKWVIEQVEAAGFKLAGKSEVNANPKDTADHPEGVWSLPPTLREKDKDREKYTAIGESDRMTLKFVKVEAKAPPAKP